MENPIKMDDLGGTPIFGNTHIYIYIYDVSLQRNLLSIFLKALSCTPGLGELRLIGAVLSDGGHTTFTRRFLFSSVETQSRCERFRLSCCSSQQFVEVRPLTFDTGQKKTDYLTNLVCFFIGDHVFLRPCNQRPLLADTWALLDEVARFVSPNCFDLRPSVSFRCHEMWHLCFGHHGLTSDPWMS